MQIRRPPNRIPKRQESSRVSRFVEKCHKRIEPSSRLSRLLIKAKRTGGAFFGLVSFDSSDIIRRVRRFLDDASDSSTFASFFSNVRRSSRVFEDTYLNNDSAYRCGTFPFFFLFFPFHRVNKGNIGVECVPISALFERTTSASGKSRVQ